MPFRGTINYTDLSSNETLKLGHCVEIVEPITSALVGPNPFRVRAEPSSLSKSHQVTSYHYVGQITKSTLPAGIKLEIYSTPEQHQQADGKLGFNWMSTKQIQIIHHPRLSHNPINSISSFDFRKRSIFIVHLFFKSNKPRYVYHPHSMIHPADQHH